jgi:hypothetical protein
LAWGQSIGSGRSPVQADAQVAAWIAQWPDCRVVAESRDGAIEAVRSALNQVSTSAQISGSK